MNVAALVLMVGLAGAAVLAWRRRLRSYAVGFGLCAVLPGWTVLSSLAWPAGLVAAAAGAAGLVWQRWSSSQGRSGRWSARARRRAGLASWWDIARRAGGFTLRRLATTVRPTLVETSLAYRWARLPLAALGVELARVGGQRVWASIEDVVLVFGGPRKGKSGWLAGRICDAPGAVLVTSTRTDLHDLTAAVRAGKGPVFVFNAAGLGGRDGLASSLCFDPLTGCTDPVIATERGEDMVTATGTGGGSSGSGDRAYWEGQASRVFAAFLHAAALGARSMHDVLGWTSNVAACGRDVPALLQRSGVRAFASDVEQFVTTNDRTRTSITNSMMPALAWLSHPAAVAAATPGANVDVAQLLTSRATVFLIGRQEAKTAALVCALIGHVARTAYRLAADPTSPVALAGRLDPPLTLALDEAALIAPVPLEQWSADMGGRGVSLIAAFQSRAQLLGRYGEHGGAAILNNAGSCVLFGGTADRDDLLWWSSRAGERDELTATLDAAGATTSRSLRRVPVVTVTQVANLRPGQVLVFRSGIDPCYGNARMAWRRRDVRATAAGLPPACAGPGLLAALRFTTHQQPWRTLVCFDHAVVAALHRLGRQLTHTLAGPAPRRRVADLRVVAQRVRFALRRLSTRRAPRTRRSGAEPAADFFAAATDPRTRPRTDPTPPLLRVTSVRAPHALEHGSDPTRGPTSGSAPSSGVEVDAPTGPIDLTAARHDGAAAPSSSGQASNGQASSGRASSDQTSDPTGRARTSGDGPTRRWTA